MNSVSYATARWTTLLSALTVIKRARATHTQGAAIAGNFKVDLDSRLPENQFFHQGRVFDAVIRHSNVTQSDDASKDARAAAVKLAAVDGSLDMTLHTGRANVFWNVPTWGAFVRAMGGGEAGFRRLVAQFPHLREVAIDSQRRAPSSFAQLVYHQPVVTRWLATDGTTYAARYRLTPREATEECGIPTGDDRERYWDVSRSASESRDLDYLRAELITRVRREAICYTLSAQLRVLDDTPWNPALDCSEPWDEERFAFLRVGELVLTRAVDPVIERELSFNIGHQPHALGLFESDSVEDFNSLNQLRARVYPVAKLLRHASQSVLSAPDHSQQTVYGRLVHDDVDEQPLCGVAIELWTAHRQSAHRKLASGTTDQEGRFVLHYDSQNRSAHSHRDLQLQVFDRIAKVAEDETHYDENQLRAVVPAVLDGPPASFNFGTCRVAFWEYDRSLSLARARSGPNDRRESFEKGYLKMVLAQNVGRWAIRAAHRTLARVPQRAPSIDTVQAHYPAGLLDQPQLMCDGQLPTSDDLTRLFADRVMNGFNPQIPYRCDDGSLHVAINFDDVESDGHMALLSGDAWFAVHENDNSLRPLRVLVSLRSPSETRAHSAASTVFSATPNDGDRWLTAQRAFLGAWGLSGVLDTHLAKGHLNVEQYAIACFRNLHRNPIRRLLQPHLREVVAINHFGQKAVFGASGIITNNSPFTMGSSLARLTTEVGRYDWSTFSPRTPAFAGHRYAIAAALFWRLLSEHVERFMRSHHGEIVANWAEIHRFSRDLVRHSAPWTQTQHRERYYCRNEIDDPSLPRDEWEGKIRAVRALTHSDRPEAGALEKLAQLCRYVLFHSTFYHQWENDLQREDGGDVRWATLGVPSAQIDFNDPNSLLPTARQATDQLYYAHGLASKTPGLITNRKSDVPEPLPTLLRQHRTAFAALGLDVDELRSRISI